MNNLGKKSSCVNVFTSQCGGTYGDHVKLSHPVLLNSERQWDAVLLHQHHDAALTLPHPLKHAYTNIITIISPQSLLIPYPLKHRH